MPANFLGTIDYCSGIRVSIVSPGDALRRKLARVTNPRAGYQPAPLGKTDRFYFSDSARLAEASRAPAIKPSTAAMFL